MIRAYVQEKAELRRFEALNRQYIAQNIKLVRIQGLFQPLLEALIGMTFLLVLWVGGHQVLLGRISVGSFVMFNTYMGMLVWPAIRRYALGGRLLHLAVDCDTAASADLGTILVCDEGKCCDVLPFPMETQFETVLKDRLNHQSALIPVTRPFATASTSYVLKEFSQSGQPGAT